MSNTFDADFVFEKGTFEAPPVLLEEPALLEKVEKTFEVIAQVCQRLKLAKILTRITYNGTTYKLLVIN